MIKYNLICKCGKVFESWFSGSTEFDLLSKKKLISCIYCESTSVKKSIMAPNLSSKSNKTSKKVRIEKDLKKQLPCAAYLNGEYGVKDIYAGVPVIIGSGGVEKVVELDLNPEEKDNFEKSIQAVRDLFKHAQKIDPSLK